MGGGGGGVVVKSFLNVPLGKALGRYIKEDDAHSLLGQEFKDTISNYAGEPGYFKALF